jgi:hypothetical protein
MFIGRPIILWRSPQAAHEGQMLINMNVAQTKPETIVPYVSCFVAHLTPAFEVLSFSFWERVTKVIIPRSFIEIVISRGEHVGCRGFVEKRYWRPA